MPDSATRALHDRLLATLAAVPQRPVCRSLPGGAALDVDSFERRIMGAERRLARLGGEGGPAPFRPGAGGLVLLSSRNLDSFLVATATLWKRGSVPLLAGPGASRADLSRLVAAFRPSACLLDRRADLPGGSSEDLGEALAGMHAWVPARAAGRRAAAAPPGGTPPDVPPDAALVRLTPGPRGAARGAVVTTGRLLAEAQGAIATAGIQADDTMVAALPLAHAAMFTLAVMPLLLQGTRLLLIEAPRPALLVEALAGPGPLVLPATPRLLGALLRAAGRKRLRGLRLCLAVDTPIPEGLSREFRKRLGTRPRLLASPDLGPPDDPGLPEPDWTIDRPAGAGRTGAIAGPPAQRAAFRPATG